MQNHDENAWKTEVQLYLRAVIEGVNAENTKETYLACLRLHGYLAKQFPDLKNKEQVDSFLKNHHIDCGLEFKKIKFSAQFAEALNQLKQDFFEQESDRKIEGKAPDTETQKIFLKTQHAIIGLDACIGMTMGDAYKDKFERVDSERDKNQRTRAAFKTKTSKVQTDITSIQQEYAFKQRVAEEPELLNEVIKALTKELNDYIIYEYPDPAKRSEIQRKKVEVAKEARDSLNFLTEMKGSPKSRIEQLERIVSELDTKNQEAEKFTNIFKKIVKAVCTRSLGNKLGHKTNAFKTKIAAIKQDAESAEEKKEPDTPSNQNPSPSNP